VAKFPWAEPIVGPNGKVKMVQCKICSTIEKGKNYLSPNLMGKKIIVASGCVR